MQWKKLLTQTFLSEQLSQQQDLYREWGNRTSLSTINSTKISKLAWEIGKKEDNVLSVLNVPITLSTSMCTCGICMDISMSLWLTDVFLS